jgi:hypothetical protein
MIGQKCVSFLYSLYKPVSTQQPSKPVMLSQFRAAKKQWRPVWGSPSKGLGQGRLAPIVNQQAAFLLED